MNYQGSRGHQAALFNSAIRLSMVALLFVASAMTALAQSPEIRQAFRYYDIEQPSKMIPALEKAAAQGEDQYYLGLGHIMAGNLDKALEIFEKRIAADKKDPLPVAGKGHVLVLQGKANEGKTLLQQAADMNRKKTAAQWEAVGRGYLADSKFLLDAISALENGKALDNGDREIHLLLGDAFLQQNRGGESVSSYERASSADPKWAKPLHKIARVYQRARNTELVMEYLQRAVEADPQYAPAWKELGEQYYLQKQPKMAVEAYEKYLGITETPGDARFQLAFFYFMAKDYSKANEIFQEVLNNRDASATALKFYAFSLIEQGKDDVARQTLEQFFQKATPEEVKPSDYSQYAKLLLNMNEDSLANVALEHGIALDTAMEAMDLRELNAETYRKRKKFEEAAQAYEQLVATKKAIESQPSAYDYFWMGYSYFLSDQYHKADTAFTAVAEQQPKSPLGYLWAAKARVQIDSTGEQGLAVPMYEQYLERALADNNNIEKEKRNIIEAYDYLGQYALHHKDNIAEATSYFKKILELDPKNERAQDFMNTVRELNNPTRGKGR